VKEERRGEGGGRKEGKKREQNRGDVEKNRRTGEGKSERTERTERRREEGERGQGGKKKTKK